MSEMVERVARAIADHEFAHLGGANAQSLAGRPTWTFCVFKARIVIAAMREPTEEMIALGEREMYEHHADQQSWALENTAEAWRTMIDEALR